MSLPAASTDPFPEQMPDLSWSLVTTLAYADVFDYPLTAAEAHRYLIGRQASFEAVRDRLEELAGLGLAAGRKNFFALPNREQLVDVRRERAVVSAGLWPEAQRYGQWLAGLPFIRMVAVSGALAVDNAGSSADIDFFLVTEPGRLWLARAVTIAVVRVASRRGVTLCPNYLISTQVMRLGDRSLFAAHELTQMVPLSGMAVYHELRRLNGWTADILPNAVGPPRQIAHEPGRGVGTWLAERTLRAGLFDALERWEMTRKVRKLSVESAAGEVLPTGSPEASFCADWCKGHLDGHAARTLKAYNDRIEALRRVLV